MNPHLAYVALGSNLATPSGGPEATVLAAMDALGGVGKVVRRSSLYRTAPVGYDEQPAFTNAVVALETALSPETLLAGLLKIEQRFGRDRRSTLRNRPRTLDLDILLYDDWVIESPRLSVPHPELARRRFVLAPLAEIAPTLEHPSLRVRMETLLRGLPSKGANAMAAVERLLPGATFDAKASPA